jgi:hypothetical protein
VIAFTVFTVMMTSRKGPDIVTRSELPVTSTSVTALRYAGWAVSDADEAIRRADVVQRETVDGLDSAGFEARGDADEAIRSRRWRRVSRPSRPCALCSSQRRRPMGIVGHP